MKIVVLKKRNQWYWKLVAKNGKTLAHSETYSSKAKARQSARSVVRQTEMRVVIEL